MVNHLNHLDVKKLSTTAVLLNATQEASTCRFPVLSTTSENTMRILVNK